MGKIVGLGASKKIDASAELKAKEVENKKLTEELEKAQEKLEKLTKENAELKAKEVENKKQKIEKPVK